ncbi:hypothetical protein D3OALGA1CA_342 [Olavius algarvensis associated proteobacterium Delta 3]|nr:hypothetical protein D3OALGA1CA_342 [Olavius algarvensis associated proteobacterium Delta 3]CAB5097703.1 hypothetical protein D3OALGB2SA_1617 [Olavius algarvensis associated proteobacterium Delta 3]
MKTAGKVVLSTICILLMTTVLAFAHCEIPCGIYDDELRARLIAEHITTVEKSMKQITSLAREKPLNYNQMVRWVTNKEAHAGEIQHIVTQYFMTQRIKPGQKKYAEKLEVLHQILLSAMKAKQTVELDHIQNLNDLLKKFEMLYFGHTLNP